MSDYLKRILFSLLLLLMAAGASAQVCEGLNVVSFRLGDNMLSNPEAGTPHMSLTYEYEILTDAFGVETLCLGAGAAMGYCFYRYPGTYPGYYFTSNGLTWALRGTAHYDVLGQLLGLHSDHVDTYATLSLGMEHSFRKYYDRVTGHEALNQQGEPTVPAVWKRRLLPGLQVGCRYWFTPNLGATLEAGFDYFSIFNVGISACF